MSLFFRKDIQCREYPLKMCGNSTVSISARNELSTIPTHARKDYINIFLHLK